MTRTPDQSIQCGPAMEFVPVGTAPPSPYKPLPSLRVSRTLFRVRSRPLVCTHCADGLARYLWRRDYRERAIYIHFVHEYTECGAQDMRRDL